MALGKVAKPRPCFHPAPANTHGAHDLLIVSALAVQRHYLFEPGPHDGPLGLLNGLPLDGRYDHAVGGGGGRHVTSRARYNGNEQGIQHRRELRFYRLNQVL